MGNGTGWAEQRRSRRACGRSKRPMLSQLKNSGGERRVRGARSAGEGREPTTRAHARGSLPGSLHPRQRAGVGTGEVRATARRVGERCHIGWSFAQAWGDQPGWRG